MFKLSILAVLEIHAPYEIKASRSLNSSFEAMGHPHFFVFSVSSFSYIVVTKSQINLFYLWFEKNVDLSRGIREKGQCNK